MFASCMPRVQLYTLTRAVDCRNLRCSIIGSCQSTATSYDCTARLVAALPVSSGWNVNFVIFVEIKFPQNVVISRTEEGAFIMRSVLILMCPP